jgi:hypothetical protein
VIGSIAVAIADRFGFVERENDEDKEPTAATQERGNPESQAADA